MSPQKKIVIIGAGPTGLGAGYRLKELGYKHFHIYERSNHLGGLASSFTDSARFTWDIGGHVMFSHYKYYDKCFDDLMGKDFQENMRECWIRMFDRWVPYPFQNNIRYLPKEVTYECLTGLVEAQTQRDYKAAKNFRALRRLGVTVRKTIDTVIATRCIESGYELLHNDRDFDPFAKHLGMRVVA